MVIPCLSPQVRNRYTPTPQERWRCRPSLEWLEDKTVLSPVTLPTVALLNMPGPTALVNTAVLNPVQNALSNAASTVVPGGSGTTTPPTQTPGLNGGPLNNVVPPVPGQTTTVPGTPATAFQSPGTTTPTQPAAGTPGTVAQTQSTLSSFDFNRIAAIAPTTDNSVALANAVNAFLRQENQELLQRTVLIPQEQFAARDVGTPAEVSGTIIPSRESRSELLHGGGGNEDEQDELDLPFVEENLRLIAALEVNVKEADGVIDTPQLATPEPERPAEVQPPVLEVVDRTPQPIDTVFLQLAEQADNEGGDGPTLAVPLVVLGLYAGRRRYV